MNTNVKLDRRARLALAATLAIVAALSLSVRPAAACTFLPTTFAEVAASSDMIFLAEVVDVPADRAYVLETGLVFRGSVPDTISFTPDPADGVSTCEAALRDGATYLFGVNGLDGPLRLGDVWLRIYENRVEREFVDPPTTDPDALISLFEGLPDTAMPFSLAATESPSFPVTELGLLSLAGAAIALGARRRLTHSGRSSL